ncbi:MAG: hypothetical protein EOM52_13290, partial [Clostridia bacterium]|nr:hypothetical protein [Clostridia bacterium]
GKGEPPKTGARPAGEGRLVWGMSAGEFLLGDGIAPDCEWEGGAEDYGFIHRRTEEADIYFVSSRREAPADGRFTFRVAGRQPSLWNPLTGEIRDAAAFRQENGRTTLPLSFDPYGAWFVVFRGDIAAGAAGSAESNSNEASPVTVSQLLPLSSRSPKAGSSLPASPTCHAALASQIMGHCSIRSPFSAANRMRSFTE